MRLSDLQDKSLIDLENGSYIGKIIDADVSSSGVIESLIVCIDTGTFKLFGGKEEKVIKWKSVKKIGNDAILVDKNE